ncbi:hypothetical protein, partial [Bacillus licheniformis]|uniref:hypothetical protein n=1 Tax=Bacillus licheniformis TaxID=1402 RepID=UPI001C92F169
MVKKRRIESVLVKYGGGFIFIGGVLDCCERKGGEIERLRRFWGERERGLKECDDGVKGKLEKCLGEDID